MITERLLKSRYSAMKHRGICEEWEESYLCFADWYRRKEAEHPSGSKLTIRRIDKLRQFSESNCRLFTGGRHSLIEETPRKVERGIYSVYTKGEGKVYKVSFRKDGAKYVGRGTHKYLGSARSEREELMRRSIFIVFTKSKQKRKCVIYDEGSQFRLRYQVTVDGMLIGWFENMWGAKMALHKNFNKAVQALERRGM